MSLLRLSIFLLIYFFSLSALSTPDQEINDTLSYISKELKNRSVAVEQIINLEDNFSGSEMATEDDKTQFLQLAKSFQTILDNENYLYENSADKWCCYISSGITATASYGLSWLKLLKPSCLFPECQEGFYKIVQYGGPTICAPNEVARVCLEQIKKSGVKNVANYARYTRECFAGLDPILDGQPIDLGTVVPVKNLPCSVITGTLLSAPAVFAGAVSCGLFIGGSIILYKDYTKNNRIISIYNATNNCPQEFIARIQRSFPDYTSLIAFIGAILIDHDETINQTWKTRDCRHIHHELKRKNSKSE